VKFPIWFSAGLIAASVATPTARPQNASDELSPAEKWVAAQVTAGETADLRKKFPKEEDRKLSAHFLERLLTGTQPDVQPQRIGVRIVWATIDDPIDISNAQIPWDIWLEHCQFIRKATIHHASFAWNVSFQYSTFKGDADFDNVKVGHLAALDWAVFESGVNFGSAEIAATFEARSARFRNGAVFSRMKVGGDALFDYAKFEGPVIYNGMKVGGDAVFNEAKFEGRVDFSYATIANNFNANKAQFQNEKNGAVFSGMKVGGDATFYSAVFDGPVHFNYADFARLSLSSPFSPKVAHQFHMQGMSYKYIRAVPQPESSPAWHNIPPLVLYQEPPAYFSVVPQSRPSPGSHTIPPLLLYSLSSEPPAHFSVVPQHGSSPGSHKIPLLSPLYLQSPAYFSMVPRRGPSLGSHKTPPVLPLYPEPPAYIRAVPQPEPSPSPYKIPPIPLYPEPPAYISAVSQPEPESESREALLNLANQSVYSADVYSSLEQFFLRQGDRTYADEVFTEGKCREREEYFRSHNWFRWLGSWVLYVLVGYGRRPWQAGIPCVILVALGCVLFSPKKMEPQRSEDTPRVYSRFWYSLGLFLPFVDLQADKVWKPKADQTFLRNYMRVHKLLGWILIPIVLAALTGLIK